VAFYFSMTYAHCDMSS